jgi:prophage tail gpP-like protein
MSDARYASARPKTIASNETFDKFILECYKDIGLTKDDFEFDALKDVSMMTGKSISGGVGVTTFDACKPDQTKVAPPETIFTAVDKHLRRFKAVHWDGANGKIVVGIPDDSLNPKFILQCKQTPRGVGNNICGFRRIRDWSEVAREVWIVGATPGREIAKIPVKGNAIDQDVQDVFNKMGHFSRLVLVPSQDPTNDSTAGQQAKRELSARRQRKDGWEILLDGWSYWDGNEQIPYAPNMTADITADVLGGPHGRHLITRTQMDASTDGGCLTRLTCVAAGIFQL